MWLLQPGWTVAGPPAYAWLGRRLMEAQSRCAGGLQNSQQCCPDCRMFYPAAPEPARPWPRHGRPAMQTGMWADSPWWLTGLLLWADRTVGRGRGRRAGAGWKRWGLRRLLAAGARLELACMEPITRSLAHRRLPGLHQQPRRPPPSTTPPLGSSAPAPRAGWPQAHPHSTVTAAAMATAAVGAAPAVAAVAAAVAAPVQDPAQGPAAAAEQQQAGDFDSSRYTLHSQGAEAVSVGRGAGYGACLLLLSWWSGPPGCIACSHEPAIGESILASCSPNAMQPLPAPTPPQLPPPHLLQRVWEGTFLGRPAIVKQRFSKQYRHPQLDAKLTAARLKSVSDWAAGSAGAERAAGRLPRAAGTPRGGVTGRPLPRPPPPPLLPPCPRAHRRCAACCARASWACTRPCCTQWRWGPPASTWSACRGTASRRWCTAAGCTPRVRRAGVACGPGAGGRRQARLRRLRAYSARRGGRRVRRAAPAPVAPGPQSWTRCWAMWAAPLPACTTAAWCMVTSPHQT